MISFLFSVKQGCTMTLDPHEINYQPANQAYDYPLIIKHLLDRARVVSAEQTISYADKFTYSYGEFFGELPALPTCSLA